MTHKVLSFFTLLCLSVFHSSFATAATKDLTFSMIKAHAFKDRQAIIKYINANPKFKVIESKEIVMTETEFEKLYGVHKGRPFFNALHDSIINKKVVAMVVKGDQAEYKKFVGNTDSKLAEKNTIRGQFGADKTLNAIHSSDPDRAEYEISIFFPKK